LSTDQHSALSEIHVWTVEPQ